MDFKEKMPEWHNEGVEPPKSKRESGWAAGDQPPADWFNWFQNRTFKSLEELRDAYNIMETVDKSQSETIDNLSNVVTESGNNMTQSIKELKDGKVDKVPNKDLSTNDYSDKEKEQNWINQGSISTESASGKVSNTHRRQVNVSYLSEASGSGSQVNASHIGEATGTQSQVNASFRSVASGDMSQVNASFDSVINNATRTQINSSINVISNTNNTSVWGYAVDGEPSAQNRKVEINSQKGEVKATGSITGNSSFADFAEYMESENGKAIPLGTLVSMGKGQKIKIAEEGDFPVGIISATAGIILNAQGFEWKDRYLYDRYGQPIYVDKYVVYIKNEDGYEEEYGVYGLESEVPKVGTKVDGKVVSRVETIKTQMLNPIWDEKEEYIPREEREEWNVVGMKGQIYVNVDETVQEGDFIQVGKNGIATKGNQYNRNWLVMEITTQYEEELGHGIARVMI